MNRFLLTVVGAAMTFAAYQASAAENLGIEDTRLWVGACPSQPVSTTKTIGAELAILVGGRLIDAGVGALGAALTAAGSPKTVSRSASINLSSLSELGGCVVLISGRFLSNEAELGQSKNAGELIAPTDAGLNTSDGAGSTVRQHLVENLRNAKIYLADEPAMYLELQIMKAGSASSFYFRPVLLSFQKALLRTAWGSSGGQRDLVISAVLASSSGESPVPKLFDFQDWDVPTHGYMGISVPHDDPPQQPAAVQPALNMEVAPNDGKPPEDITKLPSQGRGNPFNFRAGAARKLVGGLQSALVPVPAGDGPYRLTLAYSETREGSALLKALGDAITADKEKIGSLAKQAVFASERHAADEKRRTEAITAREGRDSAVEEALKAHDSATASLQKCKSTGTDASAPAKYAALNEYRLAKRKALTAYSKAGEPAEFDLQALPEVTVCPSN